MLVQKLGRYIVIGRTRFLPGQFGPTTKEQLEAIERIKDDYIAGLSTDNILARHGVKRFTVRKMMHEFDCIRSRGGFQKSRVL